MPFTVSDFVDLVRLLEEHPEWRSELRRLILTDELLELPRIVKELAEKMDTLAEQNRGLAERVDELAEQNRRLVAGLETFADRLERLTEQVEALVRWQKGEAGRREGERYERRMIRHAPLIFFGGDGGSPDDPVVRRKISEWLKPFFREGRELPKEGSPTEADLIWWKEEKVAVAEISIRVGEDDIERAAKRAETLRSVGVEAFPVVIGEDWVYDELKAEAGEKRVEWFVKGMPSLGLVAFRKLGLD